MHKNMNILICDDQKAELERLAGLLTAEREEKTDSGIKIVQFTNGPEVLNHVRSGSPVDVCFLDIFMT